MRQAALIARIIAAVVSLLYMMLLLPHVAGLNAEHFKNGWSLSGMAVALLWIPLLFFHGQFERAGGTRSIFLSFIPLVLMGTFFVALFEATS